MPSDVYIIFVHTHTAAAAVPRAVDDARDVADDINTGAEVHAAHVFLLQTIHLASILVEHIYDVDCVVRDHSQNDSYAYWRNPSVPRASAAAHALASVQCVASSPPHHYEDAIRWSKKCRSVLQYGVTCGIRGTRGLRQRRCNSLRCYSTALICVA